MANPYNSNRVSISAGTAFKAGFFGFFGWLLASFIVGAIFFVILLILGLIFGHSIASMIPNS